MNSTPLIAPIAPSAVYRITDLDALDAIHAGGPGYIYARDLHPNAVELSTALNTLHGSTWGLPVGSGMAALAVAFLTFAKPGQRIVASDLLYGKTFKLLNSFTVDYVDMMDHAAVAKALESPAALVLVETIANPLMSVADLSELAKLAHAAGAKLLVDNTFAGPTVVRPLEHGADLVMESLTKMIGGHSDVTLGYLGGRDAESQSIAADVASTWGFFASPFDCWLALRGLSTLELRMSAASANARQLSAWLTAQPAVLRVIDPGLANMLFFELPGGRDSVNAFFRAAPGLPFCPSLGHHETTLSYPWGTSHRAVAEAEKLRLGITPGLVRVSVGCEPYEQLQAHFQAALKSWSG